MVTVLSSCVKKDAMKKSVKKKRQLNRRANRQYKNNLFVYLFTRKKEYC